MMEQQMQVEFITPLVHFHPVTSLEVAAFEGDTRIYTEDDISEYFGNDAELDYYLTFGDGSYGVYRVVKTGRENMAGVYYDSAWTTIYRMGPMFEL